jgi:hypothetical protein
MNRKTILGTLGLVAVLVFIVFRTQRNAHRDMEKERAYASIEERTTDGHREWYSRHVPLTRNRAAQPNGTPPFPPIRPSRRSR